jgi:hypothetical protein
MPADDREGVVALARRKLAPEREVMGVAVFVEGERHAPVEKHDRPLDRRHLNGNEVPVEYEDWK